MRQSKHPLVERDLIGIVEHIVEVTQGDFDAAARRLDEIDDLIRDIAANPLSGMRLTGLAREKWRAPTEELGGVLWETGTDRRRSFGVKRCVWR